jgi:hypothetical protein
MLTSTRLPNHRWQAVRLIANSLITELDRKDDPVLSHNLGQTLVVAHTG